MVVFVFSSENGIIKTNDKNERGKINKNTELGRIRKKLCKKKEEKILFITLAKEKKQSSKTKLACEINSKKKQKTICKHINGSNNVDKYTKGLTKRKNKQTNNKNDSAYLFSGVFVIVQQSSIYPKQHTKAKC